MLSYSNEDILKATQLLNPVRSHQVTMSSVRVFYIEERWIVQQRLELSPEDIVTNTKTFFATMTPQPAFGYASSYYQTHSRLRRASKLFSYHEREKTCILF